MTKKEAAIVAAYTGFLIGEFSTMHEYIEEVLGRPVFTYEMGNRGFMAELRTATKKDFTSIKIEG